jgi:lipopolysaccharide/colanic/teichoic acid biosynthesis glycosyltransferase
MLVQTPPRSKSTNSDLARPDLVDLEPKRQPGGQSGGGQGNGRVWFVQEEQAKHRTSIGHEARPEAKNGIIEYPIMEYPAAPYSGQLSGNAPPCEVEFGISEPHPRRDDIDDQADEQDSQLTFIRTCAKRTFDIVVATTALVCLSGLFIAIAIAIRMDSPGPIIFRQTRIGFGRREFQILKFRTMNVLENGPSIRQASRNDPRVTTIGSWLRCTSIDELPQLWNVLVGDMSLVGPRPHAVAHEREYSTTVVDYALRHRMKPGLTGWAQVNGCRGPTPTTTSMQKRIDYDNWYINNWSIGLDLKIIVRTAIAIPRWSDAY